MTQFYHSVLLDSDKCKGCINCIKRCPTEAIRVRNGKAHIIKERCIDCGECIRVCPYHAKHAQYDSLELIDAYKYTVALPAPALYGQFNNLDDIDYVLTALLELGFDDVFEVSRAAEMVSECTRRLMNDNRLKKPVISSACPAVTRLIRVRFPELCSHILPLNAPVELAAHMARREAVEKTGLRAEEIGIFFISPCAAKVTVVKMPLGLEKSNIDGVLSINNIYPALVGKMNKLTEVKPLAKTGIIGVSWASSGGEAAALLNEKYLAADGIENVIRVLEELEDEKLNELDFIELGACSGGCVGGVLTVENPYVAKARIQRLRKYLPVSLNHVEDGMPDGIEWTAPIEYAPVLKLSDDMEEAMQMMLKQEDILDRLPALDCGSCGAPSCRALAEDVVRGEASESDCIFKLREHMHSIIGELSKFEGYIPLPFRHREDDPQ